MRHNHFLALYISLLREVFLKSVLIKLREYSSQASVSEKQIIKYILESPQEVIYLSIYKLADVTFSSASSIVRLSKKIGFSGFKEMKNSIIDELTIKYDAKNTAPNEITNQDNIPHVIEKIMNRHILAIEETHNLIDNETLEAIVNEIKKAQIIYLFGIGSSYLVAKDFRYKMLRLGKNCIIFEDFHMLELQSRNIQKGELAFVFSYSGQTAEVIQYCQNIKKNGGILISITKFGNSKIAKLSDYPLYVASSEPIKRSGALDSRISQLFIVDIIYMCYIATQYEESFSHIRMTQLDKEEKADEI